MINAAFEVGVDLGSLYTRLINYMTVLSFCSSAEHDEAAGVYGTGWSALRRSIYW